MRGDELHEPVITGGVHHSTWCSNEVRDELHEPAISCISTYEGGC